MIERAFSNCQGSAPAGTLPASGIQQGRRPEQPCVGIEAKLGASRIDEGAHHLLALRAKLDPAVAERCAGLLVIAADSPTYLRPDGVLVTSLASLGP